MTLFENSGYVVFLEILMASRARARVATLESPLIVLRTDDKRPDGAIPNPWDIAIYIRGQ